MPKRLEDLQKLGLAARKCNLNNENVVYIFLTYDISYRLFIEITQ